MKTIAKPLTMIAFTTTLMLAGPLYAGGNDSHSHNESGSDHHDSSDGHKDSDDGHHSSAAGHDDGDDGHHDSEKGKMFLVKKIIDGYDVSFHVLKAKPGKKMGGSHDFMIKVEKSGKAVENIVMNTKVVHPNGKEETKKAMKMGDWQMAGYDLDHAGKHQMMILFKTSDGKKHKGGVYYTGS